MPARRRFIADIAPGRSAFARSVLLEAWRALLPDTFDTVTPLKLRDRVRLAGSERITLTDDIESTTPGSIAGGALDLLWIDHAADVAAVPSTPAGVGVTVGAEPDTGLSTEDLAAAVVAVAGERDAASIVVFRLDERDHARSNEVLRAVRRMSSIPVTLVAHDISTDVTARRITDCALVVTDDRTVERVARSSGVPAVRLGARDSLTELYVALHDPRSDVGAAALEAARSTAFALDAWQRGRMTTDGLHASVRPVRLEDERVAA
ncbi:hypothetical protein [Curtobacterium luteum]|uniref:hypothetical protein n=1 Tax=Curtobacterium luteum TaxID=33881 RepID=UPI00380F9C56